MPGMYVYKIYEDGNYAYAGDKDTEIYQLYLVDTGNEIQLSYNYRGSGPWEENILYTFSYTDGYNIDYYTSDDNENWNISKNEVDINYINNNVFDQPLSTNIKLDFHDIVDDPGDDPDDPGDEDTYHIAFFTEGSYNNFDNNDYTFSLQPGEDNQLQVLRSDGQYVYTFDYSDGYHIDYYFSDDFDTADPPASSWQFVTGYTNYNDVNNGAMASLGSGNIKLDFYDVVNDPDDDHQFDELSIYQSGTYQDTYETSCGEHEFYFVDDNQGHLKLYNHYYEDEGSDNDTLEYTFNYNNASYLIKYYRSDSYITDYTDINDVNTILRTTDYNTKLDLYVTATPSEGSSTKIGGSSIRLKKIGNATVVKEVLNGVVIYTAE